MKSEQDIEILWNRMEKFLAAQHKPPTPEHKALFKIALHVLDWVLEKEDSSDFTARANAIVDGVKARTRKRATAKRVVGTDHFAI